MNSDDLVAGMNDAQTRPNVEPSTADLEHAREMRALFLAYVRSGFTRTDAMGMIAHLLMMESARRHPSPPEPWEPL